jgi:hypothetical protein
MNFDPIDYILEKEDHLPHKWIKQIEDLKNELRTSKEE